MTRCSSRKLCLLGNVGEKIIYSRQTFRIDWLDTIQLSDDCCHPFQREKARRRWWRMFGSVTLHCFFESFWGGRQWLDSLVDFVSLLVTRLNVQNRAEVPTFVILLK